MARVLRGSAAATLLFAALGAQCHSAPNAPVEQGFVQTVRVEPTEMRRGEQIGVWSQVTNRGSKPRWGAFMACGLGFGGDLVLSEVPGRTRCLAVSFERELAPGESVELGDGKVVDSPAGTYVLEVQQLIEPRMTQKISVRVVD